MKKIVLIGFATCYKSTVGKLLADKLGYNFINTDEEIARACNKSIQQIFETCGEAYFRQMESEQLRAVKGDNVVVACGGGAVLSDGFGEFIRDSVVIWLTALAETVHARLGSESRPLFDNLSVRQLRDVIQTRSLEYGKYAHAVFPTDGKTSEQVAEQVYNYIVSI